MTREIDDISRRRSKTDELLEKGWQPWQPPVVPLPPQAPVTGGEQDAIKPVERSARITGDRLGTGPLAGMAIPKLPSVNLEQVHVEEPDGAPSLRAADATHALGELGVIASIGQVAAAYAKTHFDPTAIAQSLGAFAKNLGAVSQQLQHLPGVGEALAAFGGAGAIAAGALSLRDEIAKSRQDGPSLSRGLGAAAAAAQLVGGVATALGTVCAPLLPVGATIMTAGAALKLGKLAWEQRDQVKRTLSGAADQANKIIGTNAGNSLRDEPVRIVSNNGMNMVQQPFAWMTG